MAASVVRHLTGQARHILSVSSRAKASFSNGTSNRSFSIAKCLAARLYTEKHEWVLIEGSSATVGISNHAQEQLGDIVYVELPEVGAEIEVDDTCGCLESVKAASDVYCPVAGEVTEVNSVLEDTPGLVNKSPLDDGWLFKMKVEEDKIKKDALLDEKTYKDYVGSLSND